MITSTTQMLADFMLSHEAEFAESITDFDYLEQFAAVLAVNYNLRNGKPHPITEGCRAVFRTAAEISAKLTYEGNIRQPMELRQLGKLLSCHHFVSVRVHGGIRGFFVIERTHNQADARKIVEQYNQERDTF